MPLFGGPPNIDKLKQKRSVKGLSKALKHKEANIRRAAAQALGEIGDEHAVEPLIVTLDSEEEEVRKAAATALGEIGDARAIESLIGILKDRHEDVRTSAIDALSTIGEKAVEPLIAALKEDRSQQAAIEALGKTGDARAVKPLLAALMDTNMGIRREAAKALGDIGDESASMVLVLKLKDKFWGVRQAAAEALGRIGWQPGSDENAVRYWIATEEWEQCVASGRKALVPLIEVLQRRDWYPDKISHIRQAAAKALGEIGDVRSVKPLITALTERDEIGQAAADALCDIGNGAVEPLVAVLSDKGESHVCIMMAAKVLGTIGDGRAVGPLIALLDYGNPQIRQEAAKALGAIGDMCAVEPLITLLKDGNKDVRQAAAEALGRIGWQPGNDENAVRYWIANEEWEQCVEVGDLAIDPLVFTLHDRDRGVRRAATETLAKIGDAAIEPLIAVLKDKERDRDTRQSAAEALGEIRDARAIQPLIGAHKRRGGPAVTNILNRFGEVAIEPLINALNSRRSDSRELAAKVLGQIGDGRVVEPLIAALNDKEPFVRQAAALALSAVGDKRAVEPLIASLNAESTGAEAAKALGVIGDERAVEPLIPLLGAGGLYQRRTAAEALINLHLSDRLSPDIKRRILETRSTITRKHDDHHGNDCAHTDNLGIGIDFPLT